MSHRLPTPARNRMHAVVLAATALCLATAVGAANPPDPEQLTTRLEQILGDAAAHKAALRSGAERVAFCTYCHGKDGNSVKPEIPKLAGQNAKYLFNQFERFAAGQRKNFVMQELASKLSADERIDIAIYFASLPVHVEPVDPARADGGKAVFDRICAACHGADGHGRDEYPRLAGQKPEYVARTLRAFRDDAAKHADATMRQVATALTAADVDTLSAYVGGLH